MSSVNKVILVGNLGKDPDVRRTQDGKAIVSFSIATAERWTDKATGDRKEKTEWHNVVIFNDAIAKVAEQYLRKGSKCYVEGQLQTRKWTDRDGVDRYSTEVVLQAYRGELVLLDPPSRERDDDVPRRQDTTRRTDRAGRDPVKSSGGYVDDMDDEIPFD